MNSHAATMVIVRGIAGGRFEALVLYYTKSSSDRRPFSSWKFPTETGEKGESPWMTACNGIYRELSQTPDNTEGFDFKSLDVVGDKGEPEPFLVCRVPGDPGKGSEWHDKCVFLISLSPASICMLRTEEKWDGPDELLGVPEFVEASELWKRMLERGQPFHRAVLYKTIERFRSISQSSYDTYRSIIEDPLREKAMTSKGTMIKFE